LLTPIVESTYLTNCHGQNFHYIFVLYHDQLAHYQSTEQSYSPVFVL